jgi:hypothetical protein
MGDRVQHADPREFPGLLRFSGEMLTYDSDRENDREPDPPHAHLGEGWLAGV